MVWVKIHSRFKILQMELGNPYNNGVTNNGSNNGTVRLKFHSIHLILFIISVYHILEWVELSSSIQLSDNPINTKNSCKQWQNNY